VKTISRDVVMEIITCVMKVVDAEVDLTEEQLELCIDVTTQTVIKSLQAQGYQLPWIRDNLRKN
jgi:hypothetical protein